MSTSDNEIGNLIKQKRKEKGLTLVELGEKINVTNGTISKWERGFIKNMGRDKIEALSNVLDIPPLVLIRGTENVPIESLSKFPNKEITAQEYEQEVYGFLSKNEHVKFTYSAWLFLTKKSLDNVIELDENQKKQIISYLELFKK